MRYYNSEQHQQRSLEGKSDALIIIASFPPCWTLLVRNLWPYVLLKSCFLISFPHSDSFFVLAKHFWPSLDMEAEQNITKWNEKRSSSFYQRNILLNSFCNLNKFWMRKQQNIFDGGLFCGFLRGGWPLPAALWWKWPKHNSFGDQLKSSYNNKKNKTPFTPFCYPVLAIVIGHLRPPQ